MSNSFEMARSYPREAERAKKEHLPILLPVGTMEYHSTHCPYGCDTLVAQGVCERVAERVDAMILPPSGTAWRATPSAAPKRIP